MAEFIVTAQTVMGKANDLKTYANEVTQKEQELTEIVNSLRSVWEGDAYEAFVAAYEKNRIALENYAIVLQKYSAALDEIAVNYDNAEASNVNIANS